MLTYVVTIPLYVDASQDPSIGYTVQYQMNLHVEAADIAELQSKISQMFTNAAQVATSVTFT
jgi:hypothetical protein